LLIFWYRELREIPSRFGRTTSPSQSTAARSSTLRNSRILPGQRYSSQRRDLSFDEDLEATRVEGSDSHLTLEQLEHRHIERVVGKSLIPAPR